MQRGRAGAGRAELGAAVVASDRRYFALGATGHAVAGATLHHLDGLGRLPAATVAWVDDPDAVGAAAPWVDLVLATCRDLGVELARVYGPRAGGPLDAALAARGFERRRELAYAGRPAVRGPAVDLHPVLRGPTDEARRHVHDGLELGPDGHVAEPALWCEAEDRRAAAGGLRLHVACRGTVPVGVAGTMDAGPVVRVKNLVVAAGHRRQGVAAAMLAAIAADPATAGRPLGVLALEGSAGEALYRSLGFDAVGALHEWSRRVGGT